MHTAPGGGPAIAIASGGGAGGEIILLVIVGTTIWVGVDVYNLRRRLGGEKIAGMGAFAWVLCSLGLWIVAFPYYLAKRSDALRRHATSPSASRPPGWWLAADGRWYPPEAQTGYRPPPPPQWPP